jgi:hypothetical protein
MSKRRRGKGSTVSSTLSRELRQPLHGSHAGDVLGGLGVGGKIIRKLNTDGFRQAIVIGDQDR